MFRRIQQIFTGILLTIFSLNTILSLSLEAQQATPNNQILLEIPRVTKNDENKPTKLEKENTWVFSEELNLDDFIRYRWSSVNLDTVYRDKPAPGGGYLKLYLNDDTKPENFIMDIGASPLPLSSIGERLIEGDNQLMFVYIDSTKPSEVAPTTKITFRFKFKNESKKPSVKVMQPQEGVVLAYGINHEFKLELNNYSLSSNTKIEPGTGKLNVYYESIDPTKLVATLNTSISQDNNKHVVIFESKDLEFNKIPDSDNTKLIFALTDGVGNMTADPKVELRVKTNYNNTVNVGLPKVTIIEPRKDRSDLNISGDQKILLKVENFEILPEFKAQDQKDGQSGYLQIFVNGSPIQTIWPREDFTLNDIQYSDEVEGRKTIKVQLVNKDFTKLAPEATDSIDIIYTPPMGEDALEQDIDAIQNDNWRYVIIALIVIMIAGGIALLVTKG